MSPATESLDRVAEAMKGWSLAVLMMAVAAATGSGSSTEDAAAEPTIGV